MNGTMNVAEQLNMPLDVAERILDYINARVITPVIGPNADMTSGVLKDFDAKEGIYEEALVGSTGTYLREYIASAKKELRAYVLDLSQIVTRARNVAQAVIDQDVESSRSIQTRAEEMNAQAQGIIADADKILTDLDLSDYYAVNNNQGNTL